MNYETDFLRWLWAASWQASVLGLVVVIAQLGLRPWLAPRWRYLLWLVVVVRLLMPGLPASSWSIFNLFTQRSAEISARPVSRLEVTSIEPVNGSVANADMPSATGSPSVEQTISTRADSVPRSASQGEPLRLIAAPGLQYTRTQLVFIVWLTGAALLSANILWSTCRVAVRLRLLPSSQNPATLSLLEECCAALAVRQRPRLLEVSAATSPALYGLLRPCLLLPAGLAESFSREELRHIFLHEVAHLRRRDVALNWLLSGIQVFHWFNPVVWLAFARLRADRELACDALALDHAPEGAARAYGETMLKLVEKLTHTVGSPAFVGILEDASEIKQRLHAIVRYRPGRRVPVLAAVVLAVLAAFTLTGAQEKPASGVSIGKSNKELAAGPSSHSNNGTLRFQVVARDDGMPLTNCAVHVHIWSKLSVTETNLHTDLRGVCLVSYPTNIGRLDVGAAMEGYVPRFATWAPERGSHGEEDVPAAYMLKLERGVLIGGKVVDQSGRPVPGASVKVNFPGQGDASWRERPRERAGAIEGVLIARTDKDGVWQTAQTPKSLADLNLTISHTNWLEWHWSLMYRAAVEAGDRFTPEDLSLRRAVSALRAGVRVTGLVRDAAGKPVAQAKIWLGEWAYEGSESAVTDDQGRFVTGPHEESEQVWLTAGADGHAPERRQIAVTNNMAPVQIQLGKPGLFWGKVVDAQGHPVAGVHVALEGNRSYPWRVQTDVSGRFEWRSAPPGVSMEFYFGRPGFLQRRNLHYEADGVERTITLSAEPIATGRVTDEVTGKPIAQFAVIPGYGSTEHWERSDRRWGREGGYAFHFTEERTPHYLRIEADEYVPFVSGPLEFTNGPARLDVKLQRADAKPETKACAGLILTPDGRPAVEAEVALCALQNYVELSGPHLSSREKKFVTSSDAAGRFKLPFDPDAHTLVVAHASGFAEVPLWPKFNSQPVQLQAWGKIEGTLNLNARPAAKKEVFLYDDRWSYVRGMWTTSHGAYVRRTDAEGRFAFDHVPPGSRILYHVPGIGIPYQHKTRVNASPGQTTVADIGLAKTQLTGRLVLSDSTSPINWKEQGANASFYKPMNQRPRPTTGKPRTELEERRESARYFLTEAGQAEIEKSSSSSLEFDANGHFVVRNLQPGTNILNINLREANDRNNRSGQLLASHRQEFVFTAAELAQTRDLGNIQLVVKQRLKPGQLAPDFTAKTLDGQDLRLADLRGKFVLLDFWATWCGPCIAELPHLRDVHETFKGDDRFVFLSLSVDEDREALAKFLAKEKPGWRQAWLGKWQDTKVPDRYGVDGIPSFFLIGPDGRLIEQGMRGGAVKSSIATALVGSAAKQN